MFIFETPGSLMLEILQLSSSWNFLLNFNNNLQGQSSNRTRNRAEEQSGLRFSLYFRLNLPHATFDSEKTRPAAFLVQIFSLKSCDHTNLYRKLLVGIIQAQRARVRTRFSSHY